MLSKNILTPKGRLVHHTTSFEPLYVLVRLVVRRDPNKTNFVKCYTAYFMYVWERHYASNRYGYRYVARSCQYN